MTLGLSQITNDAEATIKFLEAYGQYFDKWFITVADKDKKQYKRLQDEQSVGGSLWDKLYLSYFKWTDDFAAARNANLKLIDTDYWFWADSDDSLENPERLQELVRYMQHSNVDVIQLKYDYAQNENGDAVADHWRERIIKRDWDASWSTPVHEILQGEVCTMEKSDFVVVKHHKPKEDVAKSSLRNEKILRKHFEATKDPRDAYYLGMTHLGRNEPQDAIQWFIQHIKTSGWDEDQYRSWCRIAEAEYLGDNHEQALFATDEAIKLRPEFPDAYYIKVLTYGTIEQFEKAIEWLKVAMAKPEPTTLSIVDPTLYKYRGIAMGAQCYLFSGEVKQAHKLYQYCMEQSKDAFTEEFQKLFEDAYYDQKGIDYIRYLLYYMGAAGGKPKKLFEAIPPRIYADPRLNAERVKFMPKQKWPDKSIAIFCGQGTEPWGADTLDKGMGGSEEAIVYLSRELAKLGWQVTVFNDRDEEYFDIIKPRLDERKGEVLPQEPPLVAYKPWTLLNPYDEFDVFIAWRAPELIKGVKARRKIVDLHDTIQQERVTAMAKQDPKVTFMVKSKYHRSLYPKVADDRFVIVGNAIVEEQFK
jgi:tetratricopeptide (TPR) repeat protein